MAFTCAKSKLKTSEQCVKSVQRYEWRHESDTNNVVPVYLLFTLDRFHTLL